MSSVSLKVSSRGVWPNRRSSGRAGSGLLLGERHCGAPLNFLVSRQIESRYMADFSAIGGARVGWVNVTWPFARFTVSARRLVLSGLIGRYEFLPDQVASIERSGSIPVLSSGLRIVHTRSDYPAKVIFWCMGNPDKMLARIHQAGFLPVAPRSAAIATRGFPIRWVIVIAVVLVWNGLFMLDQYMFPNDAHMPGPFVVLALLLIFFFASALRTSDRVQAAVLRAGHAVGEIKSTVLLIQIVTGLLLVAFIGTTAIKWFTG